MTSEKRYLAEQAGNARSAMLQTLQELKHTLAQATDVRTCARQHPWIATGTAVAAGFVAAAVLSSPRTASGENRPATTDAGTPPGPTGHDPFPQRAGFVRNAVGTAVTGIVQTVLQGLIAAAVVAPEVETVEEEFMRPGSSPPVVPESSIR